MTVIKHEIRQGAYYDSVVLMQLQRALAELPDVIDAGVVMATPANLELLTASGFDVAHIDVKSDDLLIMVKAEQGEVAEDAISQVDDLLKRKRSKTTHDFRPKSLAAASEYVPEADWVMVSVPGRYAVGVTDAALDIGKHVFLYSDNISVEDEARLKQKAQEKGLLVMGPDCGTAIINGFGLGFANHVRRGNIGVVGASGTGLQAITSQIHNLGAGVSQAFGTGGRDLKAKVGGTSALQALDLLKRDPLTEKIVIVSKPPDAKVASKLLSAARNANKPVVINFIGYPVSMPKVGNIHFASSLQEAAQIAVSLDEKQQVVAPKPINGYLRGLFSGGTLAYEALLSIQSFLEPVYANIAVYPEQKLADSLQSQGHTILDLGEDEFTQGRLHPMMDNDLRIRRMRQEAQDPETGLIVLDIVLGEGSHPDPLGELAEVIEEIKNNTSIEFAAIVIGTADDPQNMQEQIDQLEAVDVVVFNNVGDLAEHIVLSLGTEYTFSGTPLSLEQFGDETAIINVGLESFYDSLKSQGAEAVHVDWRPPAGGNENLMAILAKMKSK